MHDTPLYVWLHENSIPVDRAREICKAKRCYGAFKTLMNHDFTLPVMALAVAKALDIPMDRAAPMGMFINQKDWERHEGVAQLDVLNYNPRWYMALKSGSNVQMQGAKCYMDVLVYRTLLSDRGIDYEEFTREHSPLYHKCRSFTMVPEARVHYIGEMAKLLDVPVETLLTNIPTINDQMKARHLYPRRITDGKTLSERVSGWGKCNYELVMRAIRNSGMSIDEISNRFAELGNTNVSVQWKRRNTFKTAIREKCSQDHCKWPSLERIAKAIGCEPEAFARRYSEEEWHDICSQTWAERRENEQTD